MVIVLITISLVRLGGPKRAGMYLKKSVTVRHGQNAMLLPHRATKMQSNQDFTLKYFPNW